ncbi:hypothetical protein KSP39_PZI000168 [Platanthera zijinensis]|uniref:SGF29 C-terminal domain-containing protein n=1 Tax=Platanthera zijinensis TaxID=2320716 RepID=A0AAP0C4C3_9ASPA
MVVAGRSIAQTGVVSASLAVWLFLRTRLVSEFFADSLPYVANRFLYSRICDVSRQFTDSNQRIVAGRGLCDLISSSELRISRTVRPVNQRVLFKFLQHFNNNSLRARSVKKLISIGNSCAVVASVFYLFEVLDEEPGDDEESIQRKYKLPLSRIIPFPKKSDPSSAPDFPPGKNVLAVYPGTTALYKATVVNTHRKVLYSLEFDDDEEDGSLPQRNVPFYRVVTLPEGHRQ